MVLYKPVGDAQEVLFFGDIARLDPRVKNSEAILTYANGIVTIYFFFHIDIGLVQGNSIFVEPTDQAV